MRTLFLLFITLVFLSIGPTCLFSNVQVGEPISETFETPHPYPGGGGVVFEKVFSYPGAGYISIHFSRFELAPADYVEISSPDRRFSYTYRGKGKMVKGGQMISEFWATHIPGDTAILRLHSRSPRGGWGVVIDQWVRGYEAAYIDALLSGLEDREWDTWFEAICGNDDTECARCYEGTEIYNKARTVARLLINGSSACTGWLLGSEGHLMTNNHCIGTQAAADNTDYEFMAEGPCPCSCSSWMACPGIVEAVWGTLVKTDSSLDYSLILLPANLTGTYGYLQFRDSLPFFDSNGKGERIYIPQHPGGGGKGLAVNSDIDGGYCVIYSTDEPPCTGGPGDIGYYCDTAGGSSGSPVIAYCDHLVVALHHCGNCPNRGVPIPDIIADMGSLLPNDAIGISSPCPCPVSAPTNVTAKLKGKNTVIITWDDNSNYEDGFKIYRGFSPKTMVLIAVVGANTTSYQDSGLASKTTYYYKVCAFDSCGENCSSIVSIKTK